MTGIVEFVVLFETFNYLYQFVWLPMHVGKVAANTGGLDTQATSDVDSSKLKTSDNNSSEPVGEWCEATTPEGYVYYWNTVTKGGRLKLSAVAFFA